MARVQLWSGKIIDDRGERFAPRVTAEDRVSLRLLTRAEIQQRRRADPARHAAITRLAVLRARASRCEKLIVLLVCAVVITVFGVLAMRNGASNPFAVPIVVVVAYAMLVVAWWTDTRTFRRMTAECATLPPSCVCCAYDLAGVPVAQDGCTVCPECGAAWDFDAFDSDENQGVVEDKGSECGEETLD